MRRFGPDVTELFVDPLTSGIYAGNIRELSVRSCFLKWMQREKEHGGILKSLWKGSNKTKKCALSPFLESMKKQSIFGLRNGMESLITALESHLIDNISYESEVAHCIWSRKSFCEFK